MHEFDVSALALYLFFTATITLYKSLSLSWTLKVILANFFHSSSWWGNLQLLIVVLVSMIISAKYLKISSQFKISFLKDSSENFLLSKNFYSCLLCGQRLSLVIYYFYLIFKNNIYKIKISSTTNFLFFSSLLLYEGLGKEVSSPFTPLEDGLSSPLCLQYWTH
jgi:hypothetical protein